MSGPLPCHAPGCTEVVPRLIADPHNNVIVRRCRTPRNVSHASESNLRPGVFGVSRSVRLVRAVRARSWCRTKRLRSRPRRPPTGVRTMCQDWVIDRPLTMGGNPDASPGMASETFEAHSWGRKTRPPEQEHDLGAKSARVHEGPAARRDGLRPPRARSLTRRRERLPIRVLEWVAVQDQSIESSSRRFPSGSRK